MSLRYTGEATMDEPALRDVERWKDKIEVRLDNRQVFFLFFGSAMVACMLFVLGVIVGKRLESRGRAEAPVIEDPLAALDRFAAPPSAAPGATPLAFPRALIDDGAKGARPEHLHGRQTLATALPLAPAAHRAREAREAAPAAERASQARAHEAVPHETVARETAVHEPVARETAAHEATRKAVAAEPSPAPARRTAQLEAAEARRAALLPHPVAAGTSAAAAVTAPASKSAALAAKPAAPAAKSGASGARTEAPAHKGNFLLQLSSFQDRAEADAFARRFSGQNAYVVASEVPGKGLWYRVRVGSYGTLKDATAAKAAFEREHGVIAYVAGTGPAE